MNSTAVVYVTELSNCLVIAVKKQSTPFMFFLFSEPTSGFNESR